MKKNLKRWLALLLAITMIVTSGAFTNLTYLRATDSETPEAAASAETQQETKTEEKEKEKKQEVKVEAKDDKAAEEAKKAEEEAKAKAEAEAKAEEQKKAEEAAKAEEQKKAEEAAKADEQKKAEEAAKADEQKAKESATTEEAQQSNEETKTEETVAPAETAQEGQKAEESTKEENKEQTYDITIKEPKKDGGSIRAWVGDAGKVDVSFKDGKYVKEVKEGETFHFEIKTKDGYTVDKVKADKHKIEANVDGNTYTYELKNIKEDRTLDIKYKEEKATDTQTADTEETSAAESQTSETGATEEETSSDDGDVPQQEQQKQEEQVADTELPTDENPTEPEQSVVDETQQEIRMPAQKLVATASDGAKVTVNAPEGALPEGTSVNVRVVRSKFVENAVAEAVEGEGKELVGYKAYDITIVGPDGNEIQPENTVKVNIKNADVNGEDATVYHVENGNADKVADVSSTENANFSAEHFSIYVIAGAEAKAVATYEFYDGETKVNTQKVKDGEKLNKPNVPVHDGKYFTGWFVEETDAKVDFDAPVSVAATATVKVVARYEEAYYVYFKNTAGVVVATKQGKNGAAISVDDVSFPLAADEGISGWYTDAALTNRVDGTVTLNGANVTVYPKVEKGYYITYEAEGGTYTKPVFVAPGQKTTAPAEPTRLGYTFKRWSTQQNGEAYTFGNELKKNITLHAVWEAKTVTYHVIYWKENADYQNTYLPENLRETERYEFASTKEMKGATGQQTAVSGWAGGVPNGFELQAISQQEIKGDGSTIVNVYLNRKVYTVEFYVWKNTGTSWWPNWTYAIDSTKTITAKYEANISSKWPQKENGATNWKVGENSDTQQVNIDTMPLNGAKFYEPDTASGSEKATYYVEVLPGETGTAVGGKQYKVHHTDVSDGSGYRVTEEDRYPITGFTLNEKISTKIKKNYNNAKFYYTRNQYKVVFNNNGATVKEEEKYYQAALTGTGDYTPTAPAGKEGYTFAGWYTNSLGEGTPFDFDTATMPARNITVYAKWVAPTFTASVHVTLDGSGDVFDITKEAGEKLQESELPKINVPEGSTFRGWYLFENGQRTTAFNFNTEIHENITLVPYWTSDRTHNVTYVANGASGSVPADGNVYAEGAYAEVLDNTGLTGPDGSPYFTGWKSSVNNQIYYPGDKIEITADITFTAQWSNQPYTSLTYYANNGTDESKSESYPNNETVTLKGKDLFAYNNYNFTGWNTKEDGSGTAFKAKAQVIVDNIGTNVLYAQWEKKVGQIGYNLTLSGATIDTTGWSKTDGYKYTVDNEYYKYPDKFTVTNRVPSCAGFEFLGWFDKARNSGGHSSSPAIRKAGESVSFIYTDKDVYTLDALWASIKAEGATYPYDGEAHTIKSAEVAYNSGNLDEKYVKQITDNDLVSVGEMQYATEENGTYTSNMPTFKNAGTYDVYCKTTVQVGSTAKTLTTKATVTINKRPVTITAASDEKMYGEEDPTFASATMNNQVAGELTDIDLSVIRSDKGDETVKTHKGVLSISKNKEELEAAYTNYTFTIIPGDFTIKTNENGLTVSAENVTQVYDGTGYGVIAQANKLGATILYKDADGNYTLQESPKQQDVGTTLTVDFKASLYGYKDAYGKATVTITKRPVTLTSATASKAYDGTPLTKPEVTVGGEGFVAGEVTDIKATGSVTYVSEGEVTNTITYSPVEDVFKAGNYDIKKAEGKLSITPITTQITVTAKDAEKVYDGTPLAEASVTYTAGVLREGDRLEAVVKGSQTDAGHSANKVTSVKVMRGDQDVTNNYTFGQSIDGTLTVKAREIELTSGSAEKTYDGTPLTKNEVKVTKGSFADGEGFDYTVTGSQTYAGNSDNEFTYAAQAGTKLTNYKVETKYGKLTVKQSAEEIVITAPSAEKKYDGKPLTVTSGATYSGTLAEGDTLMVTLAGSQTDVGSSAVTVASYKVMRGETDVTESYKFGESVPGTVKVTKRSVTLTSATAEKAYDGTPLTAKTVNVSGDGFVTGESATYAVTGSQLDAGKSDNVFTYTLGGNTKAENYTIEVAYGTLTVNPITEKKITVTANSNSKMYDGKPLTDNGYTYTEGVLVNGDVLTAVVEGTVTNVDDAATQNIVKSYKVMRGTTDVTQNYTFEASVNGELKITKRPVTLTSATASKAYDGTPLTKPEVTVGGEGFVAGEVTDIKATGSVTYVSEGEVTNTITYSPVEDVFKAGNYDIKKAEGKLSITPITTQITVTAKDAEKVYDGTPLAEASVTYTAGVLREGDRLEAVVKGSQTDAGHSANKVTSVKVMRGDQDVTNNYTFGQSIDGTLTVKAREIELTSGSAEKTYDGTPLTKNEVKVTKGSFADGEGFDYTVTGSQTYAGNSDNEFTYAAQAGTKLTNYKVETKYGKLTVKQSAEEIVITAPSAEKKYDGKPLTVTSGATYSGTLAEGDTLMVTLAGSQTDVGSSAVTVASYKVMRGETDVTESYKFGESVPGTVKVTKRSVTLTSATAEKAYDGTPLTAKTVNVSGDGFVTGESATYAVTGSQLDAGKSDNVFTYTLGGNTKAENYTIEVAYGTLTVNPITEKKITVTANSNSKMYDGKPLTDNGYTYTEGVLVNGDVLTAVVEGTVTNVDDAATQNIVKSYKVMRGTTDVTQNYTFEASVNGELKITKRPVTLTSATASKAYDGTPLTKPEVTVGGEGFVAGEGASYSITGAQTLVGSSKNTFTYTLEENTREANYQIETVFGTLTVSDKDVDPKTIVTKNHAEKADNGRYDLGETVTFTITVTNPYDTVKTITLTEQGGVTLEQTVFENVEPGAMISTTATYTITEKDVRAGSYHNKVTATFDDKSFTGEDTVTVEDGKAHLTVIKTVMTPQTDGGFKLGDTIEYSIKVKNDGNLTVKDIEVTDDLTGDVLSFGTLAGHTESKPKIVQYKVTEKDILNEKIVNKATVTKATDPDGKKPETTPDEVEVTTEAAKSKLIVNKTVVGKDSAYELGETVTYTISVTNDGNVTVKNVKVTDNLTGDVLDFGTIAPEKTTELKQISYRITEEDILNGQVVNVATVTKAEPTGGTLETVPGTATVTTVEPEPSMKINKRTTSTAPKGGYKVGDTITYAISVTNTGNVTLKDVKVSDTLTGNIDSKVLDFGTIAPKTTTDEITVNYVVTEADVSRGKVINEATGTATDPKGNEPEVTPGKTVDETEPKNSHITVTKKTTSTMPEGGYKLGDTITYEITVKNDGNQTLTNVQITDELAGLVKDVPADWTIPSLGIGESKTVTAHYVVTEADIRNGKVINDATVKGAKDPDGEDSTITPGKTEDDTEPKNSHITVTKKAVSTPKDPAGYGLGEEIKYEITVKNDGNQTLTNVVIADSLTDIVKDVPADWTIPTLAVNDEVTVTATYTVTEADIRAGKVHNEATISELTDPDGPVDPDPEDPEKPKPVTPGTDDQPTVKEESSLFISKTADQTSGLKAGDVVTYTILVVNNGNQTIKDIVVRDDLTGDSFDGKILGLGGITLKPGERKEFTVRYTITEKDVVNGGVTNVATVTGTDPNGSKVDEKTDETVDTQPANPNYTVSKTVDNPQAEYKVGDVINYTIKVTNTGNLTLNNLTVTDQMQGASGNAVIANRAGVTVNGNTATIATLAVGASIELKASYTVARADADGTLANRVNVTSTTKPGEDPENPNGPTTPSKSGETDPTPTEKTYVLTIHYVDNNGNAVAPDYTARLLAGETIDAVVSPAIDGYTPNFGTVVLPATGMPAANITVTVIYTPDGPDEVLDDPENPNRPNNGGNNGGGNAVNNNNNNANNANNADNGNNAANNNAGQADANPAPADGVIQPDDNGGYDLTPVEDTPTPLANMNLDDHACCILHFLIMLLTLIIFALYTKSRKNRQLKVEELREQLAIASIQKELDLSDEDMAKYLEEAKKLAEEKKQANA